MEKRVVVCEYALDELEREGLVELVELEEVRLLGVGEEAQVLENREGIAGGGPEGLGCPVGELHVEPLGGVRVVAAVFVDHLVEDEHDELPQCRGRGRRYHGDL